MASVIKAIVDGPPPPTLGQEGDLFTDGFNNRLYGPKTKDGWTETLGANVAIPPNTVIGNPTGVSAPSINMTQAQLTALINPVTSGLQGAAPASGGGTAKYLRADGAWSAPTGIIADTFALISSTNIAPEVTFLRTSGYYLSGDGGHASYAKVSVTPTHAAWTTSADGAKWELIDDATRNTKQYGAKHDVTVTDDTVAIQRMVNRLGYFRLAQGFAKITDSILIPATALSAGTIWSGNSQETCGLNCVGMAAKAGIMPVSASIYVVVTMENFTIKGDCLNAINITMNAAPGFAFQCVFDRLSLFSTDSCLVIYNQFSCEFTNLGASSINGHSFDIQGGNTTLLKRCYAYRCGANKAGYRIRGSAKFISCNGVNEITNDCYWAWVGDTGAGSYSSFDACNLEAWNLAAVRVENGGSVEFRAGSSIQPRATYVTVVENHGAFLNLEFGVGLIVFLTTRTGLADIISDGAMAAFDSSRYDVKTFTAWRNLALSINYPVIWRRIVAEAGTGKMQYAISRDGSFHVSANSFIAVNATTSAAALDSNAVQTQNTGATTLLNLTGGIPRQDVKVFVNDAFTTIKHLNGGAGQFKNKTGADIVTSSGDVYTYVLNVAGTTWIQQ